MKSGSLPRMPLVEWAFLGLIFSLPFARPNIYLLGSSVVAPDLIFLVCAAALAAALLWRRTSLQLDRIYVYLIAFAAAIAVSAALSTDVGMSLRRMPAELYLISLPVLVINVVRDERMLTRIFAIWIVASAIAAAASAWTAISFFAGWENALATFAMHHYGTLPPGNYPRIQGTFEYPAMLCNYLTVGLFAALAFRRAERLNTAVFVSLLSLFLVAILFTLTPGIGGVLAGLGLWTYLCARSAGLGRKLALAGAIAFVVALAAVSSITPFGTAGPVYFSMGGYDIRPTARMLAWQQAWATFAGDPLFGRGVGLPVVNLPYQLPAGGWSLITDAHNVALNVAAQTGLLGIAALASLVYAVMRRSSWLTTDCSGIGALRISMSVALVSCLLIQGIAGSFENARHVWVLIGLIVAADRITRIPQPTEEPRA